MQTKSTVIFVEDLLNWTSPLIIHEWIDPFKKRQLTHGNSGGNVASEEDMSARLHKGRRSSAPAQEKEGGKTTNSVTPALLRPSRDSKSPLETNVSSSLHAGRDNLLGHELSVATHAVDVLRCGGVLVPHTNEIQPRSSGHPPALVNRLPGPIECIVSI